MIVAENEQEAIARFNKSPDSIRMLATHVIMPSNDEADPAKQILELKPELPGLSMFCQLGECESWNCLIDLYILHKPFEPVYLRQMVRKALDLQKERPSFTYVAAYKK